MANEPLNLWKGWSPLPTQVQFLKSKAKYRLLGSGYGSGKSKLGCRESIRHAVENPGTRHLIGRHLGSMLEKSTMVTFWRELMEIGFEKGVHYEYNAQKKEVYWANGSTTLFMHMDDPTGATYGSLEITTAFLDEGSEIPDVVYKVLFPSRLRWHRPTCDARDKVAELLALGRDEEASGVECDCPLRAWVCTNPGPSGYLLEVVDGVSDQGWDVLSVPPFENPFNGPEWKRDMERKAEIYGPEWAARYIEGSWDVFEGQRFPQLSSKLHIMDEEQAATWQLGDRHQIIEGWDFGHHETFVTWIAVDEYGEDPIVVFDELQAQQREGDWIAGEVIKRRQEWGLDLGKILSFGDPAGRQAGVFASKSAIQFYHDWGLYIAPCDVGKNPQARADILATLIGVKRTDLNGREYPGIVWHPRCRESFRSCRRLRWNTDVNSKGEMGQEKFVKVDDHGFDSLGYGLAGISPTGRRPGAKPPPVPLAPDVAQLMNQLR